MKASIATTLVLIASLISVPRVAEAQTLEAFAVLPADTFAPGPTSGQFIPETNNRVPPFVDQQPVQGISSVLPAWNGDFLVMSDNGFGVQDNSADYVLRVYRIDPKFKTRFWGDGSVRVKSFIALRDPNRKINFSIVADGETYYGGAIPVDPQIRERKLLTGADFDIESFREAPDGTLWFGDEFGPFLLHTDHTGKVLEAPIPLPGVKSPQNPFLGSETPNLPRSKGFEGMAISLDGKTLYPMLEGALATEANQRKLVINEFSVKHRRDTGRQWFYRLEADSTAGQAIGDFTAVTKRLFLVIERDGGEGATALFKKIFVVNLDEVDAEGFLIKREVADLMNIADPHNLGGQGATFTFPFQTIESVFPIGNRWLGVLNDNNYPFSDGRTPGEPDPNEFIIIKLDEPLFDWGWWDR